MAAHESDSAAALPLSDPIGQSPARGAQGTPSRGAAPDSAFGTRPRPTTRRGARIRPRSQRPHIRRAPHGTRCRAAHRPPCLFSLRLPDAGEGGLRCPRLPDSGVTRARRALHDVYPARCPCAASVRCGESAPGAHLPQGAPTSPALANLVAYRLDRRLTRLARTHRAGYTRYADDLAFSGTELAVDRLIHAVGRIVADEGFSVHTGKTRIMWAHRRQHLAGLVVNTRPQVARTEYDDLRALLFNCARYGPDSQNRDGRPYFREYVYGRIAWVGESNASRKRSLHALAARVDWADQRR
ncbi:reverse transcriptase family protein [Rhodococcus opacus]|uniref:reverse transcriptase family protein n=1 Tax=Rhodococcus opacus TaxID=37919 RepID=UPI0029545620|nr:reverse transcriptase family protein [Rhodococcus opacus]MDV7090286.1 reverse transcriptase family protein [Rhodococcus opacus]